MGFFIDIENRNYKDSALRILLACLLFGIVWSLILKKLDAFSTFFLYPIIYTIIFALVVSSINYMYIKLTKGRVHKWFRNGYDDTPFNLKNVFTEVVDGCALLILIAAIVSFVGLLKQI